MPPAGYQAARGDFNPVSNVVLGLIALGYLYRVIRFRPEPSRSSY